MAQLDPNQLFDDPWLVGLEEGGTKDVQVQTERFFGHAL
jgi:hypothetical protein